MNFNGLINKHEHFYAHKFLISLIFYILLNNDFLISFFAFNSELPGI
jgi:hypothetical protein